MTVGTVGVASAMGYLALEDGRSLTRLLLRPKTSLSKQYSVSLLSDIAWGASGAIAVTAGVLFSACPASAVKEEQE